MTPGGLFARLWNRIRHFQLSRGQETREALMPDAELISCTQPPAPFASALMDQDEAGMEQLLDLLFACHAKVDDIEDLTPWYECEVAWNVKLRYEQGQVAAALQSIAPTWEDAMRLSEEWLGQWRHNCGEFERWMRRRTEQGNASALSFFRVMMITRCPKLRRSIVLGSE